MRLGDVKRRSPGLQYYIRAIQNAGTHSKIYICTDSPRDTIIQKLQSELPNTELLQLNEIETIQFASTCKNIVLSHGTYSAIIGYLSFFSDIYYPSYKWISGMWHGDIFSIEGWNEIMPFRKHNVA